MGRAKYTFELDEIQEKEFDEWKEKIKDLMGSYGGYTFIFRPNSIGCGVTIHSDLINKDIDVSHQENW